MDSLWYGHKYGMIDDDVFDVLWNKCEVRLPNLLARGVHRTMHQLNDQLKEIEGLEDRRKKAEELFLDVIWNANHRKVQDSPECKSNQSLCLSYCIRFQLTSLIIRYLGIQKIHAEYFSWLVPRVA